MLPPPAVTTANVWVMRRKHTATRRTPSQRPMESDEKRKEQTISNATSELCIGREWIRVESETATKQFVCFFSFFYADAENEARKENKRWKSE